MVEHLAVREAALEIVAEALKSHSALTDLGERLESGLPNRRRTLNELDQLARGVQAINLNQGHGFDAVALRVGASLRKEIKVDLDDLIPAVRHRVSPERLDEVLPSARHVRHHAPSHLNPDGRRPYERFRFLVRLHALWDWMRTFPHQKPKVAEAEIPVANEPRS